MGIDVLSAVSDIQQEDADIASKLSYEKFLEKFLEAVQGENEYAWKLPDVNGGKPKPIIEKPEANKDKKYVIIKEPYDFLHLFRKCKTTTEADKLFSDLLKKKDQQVVSCVVDAKDQKDGYWFNSTANGINLRPGLQDCEVSKPTTVQLGDDAVHGIVAGRTGSGKSVFLNSLLSTLMVEYSPWELNLFLADFKMVELSRYLSEYDVPHVKAVAATSEIKYVVSLLMYLANCMKARQNFFKLLGVQKIKDFRKKYEIVLPRVLFLVDEFQQMFTESTNRELNIINDLLTSITKLGRATGFHLLFSSQEMTGTLSSSVFANFKAKFVLQCTEDVSTAVLGNSAGAKLKRIGIILSNCRSSYASDNVEYQVPFIDADTSDFFNNHLKNVTECAEKMGYSTFHKFYQEDQISDIDVLYGVLDKVSGYKNKQLKNSSELFDIFVLGDSVVFNNKKVDYETVFVENGLRKNIGIFTPKIDDAAYLNKLLATNIKNSPRAKNIKHYVINRNDLIVNKYDLREDIEVDEQCYSKDFQMLNDLGNTILWREDIATFINNYDPKEPLENVAYRSFLLTAEHLGFKIKEDVDAALRNFAQAFTKKKLKELPAIKKSLLKNNVFKFDYFWVLENLYKNQVEGVAVEDLFEEFVVWVLGVENINKIDRNLENAIAKSSNYNIKFIFFANTVDFNEYHKVYSSCDYLFISGNTSKMYDRLKVPFTKRSLDSIAIDFFIKSQDTMRSFKRFAFELNEPNVPQIDFDKIL